MYNGIIFDSAPELAFYIWLRDHSIQFEYQPKDHLIKYEVDGVIHTYYPDFFLIKENLIVEIKGDWFFKKMY